MEEICQLIPAVDKNLKNALRNVRKKMRKQSEDEALALKQKLIDKAKKVNEEEKTAKKVFPKRKFDRNKYLDKKNKDIETSDAFT